MSADTNTESNIDWHKTTWEGSRKAQLKQWLKLSLRERLQTLENMGEKGQLKNNK
jgi:hypothetical protein